ncbi:SDR family NAD(P)-dependent oxidoreductase [Oceanomicrobium pacificus]|uniref:Glucose 1-dehydrogenase n=1 Tax=Oceanomicrobium pacificus TaxID=2692916 RepID=A0A6B0TR04_9RHOB|nr:glucose 1-dehydrogenase [Oceanomicrobium pacificus]MXU65119.1 glucose 1-dehydrogenase [Oceanomicrobium pacificus]
MNLKGKTAIVTGGGRDIGRACVMALAEAGANVAINYHSSAEGAESAVAEITAKGGKAFAMKGDMTNPDDVNALVDRAASELGGVDILVNNTGGLIGRKSILEMDLDHWQKVMDLNLTSIFHAVKAAVPRMKNGGAIVNIASQAGRDGGGPGAAAYATSKGAVITLTRALAKELGPDIRVNSINPGMIDTDFHNIFTKDAVRTAVANATPLKREGRPEEVGDLVAYLASDKASFMTGASVDLNGGTVFS